MDGWLASTHMRTVLFQHTQQLAAETYSPQSSYMLIDCTGVHRQDEEDPEVRACAFGSCCDVFRLQKSVG